MAFYVPHGGNAATSGAVAIASPAVRAGDPFAAASLTLTELVASTAEAWIGFDLTIVATASNSRAILSVFKGAAGAETRIASLPGGPLVSAGAGLQMYVPVPVAAGTRLSIGASGSTTWSGNAQVCGIPASNFARTPSWTVMDCGPFDLSGGSGSYAKAVAVDPGATANAKGAWTEIAHSGTGSDANNVLTGTSTPHAYDFFGFMTGDNFQPQTDQERLWDFAYGAAGSETVFVSGFHERITGGEETTTRSVRWLPWGRASGDRVAARMQASITDAADRIGTALLFGVR